MTWPTWTDEIREAYLANTASVFLLHGPGVDRGSWPVDGQPVDCAKVLTAFLSQTRSIVGVLSPSLALSFAGLGDVGQFERLVSTAMVLGGEHLTLQDDVPEEALGKIWLALSTADTPQGYVITAVDTLYPERRSRVIELAAQAPPLWQWCTHDRIRAANHIVLLLVNRLEVLRPELIEAAHGIRVELPGQVTAPVSVPDPIAAPHPTPADLGPSDDAPPPPPPASKAVDPAIEALRVQVEQAVRDALANHPSDHWAAKVPFMDAAAQVMTARTGSPGPLSWSVDEEGVAIATGVGADAFMDYWRSDIVLDASAGMILSDLKDGHVPDTLSATGLRALAKRIYKVI